MTHLITVVSLGPGPKEFLTLGAIETLKNAEKTVLRTRVACEAADYLESQGVFFETLDFLHEQCEDFDELIAAAVDHLLSLAKKQPVCYAVFDAGADETVKALAEKTGIRIVAGVPLSAPYLAAFPSLEKIEIQTASSLEITSLQNPLLILECDSRMLMGQCKLQLLRWYDPDQPVCFFPPSSSEERPYLSSRLTMPLYEIDRQKEYDHTCAVFLPSVKLTDRKRFDFFDLVRIMDRLRAPDGCPWDREQDHHTLRKYLIEEAYETGAAIDEEDWDHVSEELGDVLLQVVFQSKIGSQTGTFDLSDVTTRICRKMIARHRHIFGADKCETAEEVRGNWEKIKKEERGFATQGEAMRDIPAGLPPMVRAYKAQKKARDVGFDWDNPLPALEKVREETEEAAAEWDAKNTEKLEEELGDLLFACVSAARLSGVDPECALQKATEKFISRFCAMENMILQAGKRLEDLTLSEMDVYWKGSKQCPRAKA